jgi:uncharacterized membrane protein
MREQATRSDQTTGDEPILMDAVVYPHRSLSRSGFLVLMGLICACSFTIGMLFFMVGAWPVIGFLGLDVLVVYIAFRLNYRAARAYEVLHLTRSRFEITKVDPRGRGRRAAFEPTWLAVDMDDPPHRRSKLILRSHGKRLEIGGFLTPAEKLDLARAIRRALDAARAPVFEGPDPTAHG